MVANPNAPGGFGPPPSPYGAPPGGPPPQAQPPAGQPGGLGATAPQHQVGFGQPGQPAPGFGQPPPGFGQPPSGGPGFDAPPAGGAPGGPSPGAFGLPPGSPPQQGFGTPPHGGPQHGFGGPPPGAHQHGFGGPPPGAHQHGFGGPPPGAQQPFPGSAGPGGAPGFTPPPAHGGGLAPYPPQGFGGAPAAGGAAMVPARSPGSHGPVGTTRNPVMVLVLSMVCFVYAAWQLWQMLNELKAFRGRDDLNPIFFFIPILGLIEMWKLPEKVLEAKRMAGVPNPEVPQPILYLFLGIYFLPNDLNEIWQAAGGSRPPA